jgi:hypothetical protein
MIAGVGHHKNMAVCQEWDKQDFNFQKHIFGKSRFTQ